MSLCRSCHHDHPRGDRFHWLSARELRPSQTRRAPGYGEVTEEEFAWGRMANRPGDASPLTPAAAGWPAGGKAPWVVNLSSPQAGGRVHTLGLKSPMRNQSEPISTPGACCLACSVFSCRPSLAGFGSKRRPGVTRRLAQFPKNDWPGRSSFLGIHFDFPRRSGLQREIGGNTTPCHG